MDGLARIGPEGQAERVHDGDATTTGVPEATETTPVPAVGVWDPGRRRLTIGLVLTITLVAFESLAIATVMPIVEDDLGHRALYGWVFSGFFLASLAGIVITGMVTDRRGPRPAFAVGLVVFSVGLVIGGLAPSMPVLVGARILQGFGAGAIPASAYASVARGYPPATRPRVFALFSTAWVLPGVIGPTIATEVEAVASWHWVFLGLLPIVAVAAAIAVPALGRLPRGQATGPPDAAADRDRLVQVGLLVGGVGLVLAGTTAGNPAVAVPFVVVGGLAAVRAFRRVAPAGTLRLREGLPAIVAVRGILTFAFFGADAYISLAVTEGRGGSTRLAGVALTATALLWATGSWIQQRIVADVGPRRLDRIGFSLVATGCAGMVVTALAWPAWTAIGVWSVAGLGMGLAHAPLSLSALGTAEPGREGWASASLQLCDVLGVSLGTGLGGSLIALADTRGWDPPAGVTMAFVAAGVAAVGGIAAARRLPLRVPGMEASG